MTDSKVTDNLVNPGNTTPPKVGKKIFKMAKIHRKGDRYKSTQQPYTDYLINNQIGVYIYTNDTPTKRYKAFVFSADNHTLLVGEYNAPKFRRIIEKTDIAYIMEMPADKTKLAHKLSSVRPTLVTGPKKKRVISTAWRKKD